MGYLNNAWYAAAFSDEIGDTPLGRTLLEQQVVFFRRSDRSLAALHDRCPHRFAPLSRGIVVGDNLRCGYHGLQFTGRGECEDIRLSDQNRENAFVRSYPVTERYGVAWIWMGEAALADPADIPEFAFLDDPERVTLKGMTYVRSNYQLEIDNLMDLSHLDYVHLATIANGSITQGTHNVKQDGKTVYSNWWSPDVEMPFQFRPNIQTPDWKCDSWYEMRWDAPGIIMLDVGVCPVGAANRTGKVDALQAHLICPETESTCLYFWIISLIDHNESQELLDAQRKMIAHAFENEDRPMIEAQQSAMRSNDFWAERPVIFPEDAGAVRARRVLEKLIRSEHGVAEAEAQAVAAE